MADEQLVGWRVEIWWAKDKRFYPGIVNEHDPRGNMYHVLYDDGYRRWYDLSTREWRSLPTPGRITAKKKRRRRATKKKRPKVPFEELPDEVVRHKNKI